MNDSLLPELLLHANINDKCLKEAQFVFKKKYGREWFSISGPFVGSDENAFEDGVVKKIKNFDVAKQFLCAFGKYIQSIGVYFTDIDESEGKEIVKYINDMCFDSTTLKRLSLDGCVGGVLDELNNTFSSVEIVWFSSGTSDRSIEIRPNARKLSDIFPNAKTLRLVRTAPSDWELIGKTFPRLSDLEVELKTSSDETKNLNVQVINFLKDNSKINKLIIERSNLKFLKDVNDILPKLRYLELGTLFGNYLNYQGDPIRFKQVEKFNFRTSLVDVYPDHIHFEQLFELEMYIRPEFNNKWTEFIHNQINGNLSILILNAEMLTNDQILAIVKKKPNLKEAKIVSSSNISADTIIAFIKHSEHLRRLQLILSISQGELQQLQDKIGDDWVINLGRYGLTLIRKEVDLESDLDDDPEDNGSTAPDSMKFLTIFLTFVLTNIF